ncbi:hypothetical protein [Streptomyces phaeoluteigriseus]|uniref:hypothetical protein n=1 Tax=Streptomyces phaeoluteigriseus TaxID=114686 RepID=UPI003680B2B5
MILTELLASVARTARLGPVHVDASWDDVTAALGEPRQMLRSRRRPRLFGYGDLEVLVCRCRQVRLVTVRTWAETVELPTYTRTFSGEPTEADVVAALDRSGCPWEVDAAHTFDGQRGLRVPATSALFVFAVPATGEPRLHSMGLPDNGHRCPAAT